jgi:outer membrane protein assembly factor BamB
MPTPAARTPARPRVRPLVTLAAAAALALAAGAGGCASSSGERDRRTVTADERARAVPTFADEFQKLGYRLEWRGFPTMMPGGTVRQFDVLGDAVVVMESDGVVSVLEPRSGQSRWSDQVAGKLTKFVGNVRDGDRLIVSSESDVYVYDVASGALRTRQRLSQVVNTRPVKVGETLVYGCVNGQVLGHTLIAGARLWGSGLTGAVETDPIPAGAGRVALVSTSGDVALLDGATGVSQGRARIFAGSTTELAASDTLLFVASMDQSLYAFGLNGLPQVWRHRTDAPLTQAPVFHQGKLYCDLGAEGFACMDASTGKITWANKQVHGRAVAIRNKRVLVWDGREAILLDPAKGAVVDRAALPGIAMLKADSFADGAVYAVAGAGVVAKYLPR